MAKAAGSGGRATTQGAPAGGGSAAMGAGVLTFGKGESSETPMKMAGLTPATSEAYWERAFGVRYVEEGREVFLALVPDRYR